MSANQEQTENFTRGDRRTPIGRTLAQGGAAIDGTGLTLEARLVAEDGEEIHDWTSTGVSWNPASEGKAQYEFQSSVWSSIATHGGYEYFLWFRVTASGKTDVFPCDGRKLRILVNEAD